MGAAVEERDAGNKYIHPGELFAHFEPYLVTTVLGSCIAVCLFDIQLKIGGINHYMLPVWNGKGLPEPKYGNIAIRKLIEKMELYGSKKTNLQAKIFGGASMHSTRDVASVGLKNTVLAKDMLAEVGIPIVGSDLGGDRGRKLLYDTATGKVQVRMLKKTLQ